MADSVCVFARMEEEGAPELWVLEHDLWEGGEEATQTRTERVTAMRAVLTRRLSERSASHPSLEERRADWAAAHTPLRRHWRDVGTLTGPAR